MIIYVIIYHIINNKNFNIDMSIKYISFIYSAFAAKSPQYTVFAETEYLTKE